jgi:CyaY protein
MIGRQQLAGEAVDPQAQVLFIGLTLKAAYGISKPEIEAHLLNETEYRRLVQDSLEKVEKAFENVDPDIAECEQAFGALTITFADKSRCILSAQPSVRQLWVALASRGTAYHFDFDPERKQWIDDKGRGLELISFLRGFFKETTGLDLKL